MTTTTETLHNGHVVSKCGVAALEYLIDYAARRGIEVGEPTPAGKSQHGKHASLIVEDGKLHKGSFLEDIKGNRKLRRLSPRKFTRVCDATAAKRAE